MIILTFVVPVFFNDLKKTTLIKGHVSLVTNHKNEEFGLVSVRTETGWEKFATDYCTIQEAIAIVERNGGIWVKEGFSYYEIEDVNEIKHLLSHDEYNFLEVVNS